MQLLQTELSDSTQKVDQLESQLKKKFEVQLQNVQVCLYAIITSLLYTAVNKHCKPLLSCIFDILFAHKVCV